MEPKLNLQNVLEICWIRSSVGPYFIILAWEVNIYRSRSENSIKNKFHGLLRKFTRKMNASNKFSSDNVVKKIK